MLHFQTTPHKSKYPLSRSTFCAAFHFLWCLSLSHSLVMASVLLPPSLQTIVDAHPSVRNVFTDGVWLQLTPSNSTPFESDKSYLEAIDTIFLIR